jgi:hypothetical protein
MAFGREIRHPGLDALGASAAALAEREGWLRAPPDSWLPEPDAVVFGSLPQPNA